MTRFELAASTSLTWRATSCATPRSLCLASVSQQTQALLYKSVSGKARGIFRYSANTQPLSDLQRLLRPIMHLRFAFLAFTDAFRSSTCISALIFQQIRIISHLKMHPCQTFSANQEHFSQANASLNRLFCKSGSFFPCKCIPEQTFLQIRITFLLANASLNGLSCKSGSLFPRKCIPEQTFLQIRIISHLQMHPCQSFPANQDHFSLANASRQNFPANQDHFPQAKLCWNIDRNQSPTLFHKLPVPGQIIQPIYNSGGRYRIEEFGHREVAVIASELEYIADFSVNLLHAVS